MKHSADDQTSAPAAHADEEYGMPCAEALLAGVLALMTGHAQACCDGHRETMAKKIVQNLFLLSQHANLSPDFKTVVWNLHTRWVQQVHLLSHSLESNQPPEQEAAAQDAMHFDEMRTLWHTTHEVIQ